MGAGIVGFLQRRRVARAAEFLTRGAIVAYPTEAVYGLGCLPLRLESLAMLLSLKARDPDKGLIVIAATLEQLTSLIYFPDRASRERVLGTWPGPVSWVVPARPHVPPLLRGSHSGLAVRVTQHPIAAELCRLAGPLVATSANPAGQPPARSAGAVRGYFGRQVDYVLAGSVGGRDAPSELRDACTGAVLRGG